MTLDLFSVCINYKVLKTLYDISQSNPIILFDGVCNLCNGFVKFVIRNDPKRKFRFVPLQEFTGSEQYPEFKTMAKAMNTVILLDKGKISSKSSAALKISRQLAFPVNLGYVFILFPVFIRNAVYDYIAHKRYRWFGRQDTCMIPSPELLDRFIKQ